MTKIPVVDTFCFNGEWIVPLRLEYLNDRVDAFVIVESWMTHSGVRKPALFREVYADWFAPYASKIHWIVLEDFPAMTAEWVEANRVHAWMLGNQEAWFRESYQRDASMEYIRDLFRSLEVETYLVHVSDADEIPNGSLFHEHYKETLSQCASPVYLEQAFFYYNFNWKKPYLWYRAFILNEKALEKQASFTYWRISQIPEYVVPNGGWHFSYFMTAEELQRKLHAFAHRECDQAKWRSLAHIRRCIENGVDLFERVGEQMVYYDPLNDAEFPAVFVSYIDALKERQRS